MKRISYLLLVLGVLTISISYPVFSQAQRISAKYVKEDIPLDPTSNIWNKAETATISLTAQKITAPFGGGSVASINVRALHNGEKIGFLVEWADATKDDAILIKKFRDAVALQFPAGEKVATLPSPFMGDEKNPVNIWQWRADWEADLAGAKHVEEAYPAYADYYDAANEAEFKEVGERAFEGRPVDDLMSKGFGTLARQEEQNVKSKGTYEQEKWRVVFLRELKTNDVNDAQFLVGETKQINFAVWDGSKGDVGARKSVSIVWHELNVESPMVVTPLIAGIIIVLIAGLGIAVRVLRRKKAETKPA